MPFGSPRHGDSPDALRGAFGPGTVAGGVITALVLLNVEPGRVKSLAEELLAIDGVTEVYSVAGPYDLVAVARLKQHELLNDVVTEQGAALEGIQDTETLIAFCSFSKKDLGLMWDLSLTHIADPMRLLSLSYAGLSLKKNSHLFQFTTQQH